jgi:hypothetical protein
MYRSGLVDTLVTHANTNGVWPNSLVRRPPWLHASSVKNKQTIIMPTSFFFAVSFDSSLHQVAKITVKTCPGKKVDIVNMIYLQ